MASPGWAWSRRRTAPPSSRLSPYRATLTTAAFGEATVSPPRIAVAYSAAQAAKPRYSPSASLAGISRRRPTDTKAARGWPPMAATSLTLTAMAFQPTSNQLMCASEKCTSSISRSVVSMASRPGAGCHTAASSPMPISGRRLPEPEDASSCWNSRMAPNSPRLARSVGLLLVEASIGCALHEGTVEHLAHVEVADGLVVRSQDFLGIGVLLGRRVGQVGDDAAQEVVGRHLRRVRVVDLLVLLDGVDGDALVLLHAGDGHYHRVLVLLDGGFVRVQV